MDKGSCLIVGIVTGIVVAHHLQKQKERKEFCCKTLQEQQYSRECVLVPLKRYNKKCYK